MSYGIMPYAVRLSKVEQAIGSRDQDLAEVLKFKFDYMLEEDERMRDPDDEDEPSLEQVVEELIQRKRFKADWDYSYKYGYALKMLCDHFGRHLPNDAFCPMGSEWGEQVDQALVAAGIPKKRFSINNHLMSRGAPVAIPASADFPYIGFLREEEVDLALDAFQAADLTSLTGELQNAARQVRGWLEECVASGDDLVCFYH